MERMKDCCPCCGAAFDYAVVFTGGDAFCMECGEVFSINEPNKSKDYEKAD